MYQKNRKSSTPPTRSHFQLVFHTQPHTWKGNTGHWRLCFEKSESRVTSNLGLFSLETRAGNTEETLKLLAKDKFSFLGQGYPTFKWLIVTQTFYWTEMWYFQTRKIGEFKSSHVATAQFGSMNPFCGAQTMQQWNNTFEIWLYPHPPEDNKTFKFCVLQWNLLCYIHFNCSGCSERSPEGAITHSLLETWRRPLLVKPSLSVSSVSAFGAYTLLKYQHGWKSQYIQKFCFSVEVLISCISALVS